MTRAATLTILATNKLLKQGIKYRATERPHPKMPEIAHVRTLIPGQDG